MIIYATREHTDGDDASFASRKLQLFRNPEFTTAHLMKLHQAPPKHEKNIHKQATEIRYCLIQAAEYLKSANAASLATKPVLLYYAIMSLALVEILAKNDGNHRLNKLRQNHSGHGLSLKLDGGIDSKTPLSDILNQLRAVPQLRTTGVHYGTFEVWRNSNRESPVPGVYTTDYGDASTSGVRALLWGEDTPPKLPLTTGYTLADAISSLPQLTPLLEQLGIPAQTVRATISQVFEADNSGTHQLTIHPCSTVLLEKFQQKLVMPAFAINHIEITELPNGMILKVPLDNGKFSFSFSHPPAVSFTAKLNHFIVNGWDIGEFGSFYVALHICGNLARYFPDIWMKQIEESTSFSLIVEQLCVEACRRIEFLCMGELERCYYIRPRPH